MLSSHEAPAEKWRSRSANAPFRASIDGNACWETSRPGPDLAAALKTCPGGRVLLAFELAEIRDYFVEGHLDQGAQSEADGIDVASARRRPAPTAKPKPASVEEAAAIYIAAKKRLDLAYAAIEAAFNGKFQRLLDAGEVKAAVSVLRAMPDTHLRSIAITRLGDSGLWDFRDPLHNVPRQPYSREQAAAMVEWQRAAKVKWSAEDALGELAMAKARELLSTDGLDALRDFEATLPRSMTKAFVADMIHVEANRPDGMSASPRVP